MYTYILLQFTRGFCDISKQIMKIFWQYWIKWSPKYVTSIPHICHFFYTDRIFENQILHPKKRLKAPKTLKMSLKKSNICIFFTQSGKIYTWQKIFTQTCLWCLWQIWGMFPNSALSQYFGHLQHWYIKRLPTLELDYGH